MKSQSRTHSSRGACFALVLALAGWACGAVGADTIAVNFMHNGFAASTGVQQPAENTQVLDGFLGLENPTWYNLGVAGAGGVTAGTGTIGLLNVSWWSSNDYAAGSEGVTAGGDASQQPFRVYLDDGDGGASYQAGDGYGVSVQVTGLSALLASQGAASYTLHLLLNTDNTSFTQPQIRAGTLDGSTLIASLPALATPSVNLAGNGTWPVPVGAQTTTSGTRGYAAATGLTADEIVIALPSNAGGGVRGSMAGFTITPVVVPEPNSGILMALGLIAGWRRRRQPSH